MADLRLVSSSTAFTYTCTSSYVLMGWARTSLPWPSALQWKFTPKVESSYIATWHIDTWLEHNDATLPLPCFLNRSLTNESPLTSILTTILCASLLEQVLLDYVSRRVVFPWFANYVQGKHRSVFITVKVYWNIRMKDWWTQLLHFLKHEAWFHLCTWSLRIFVLGHCRVLQLKLWLLRLQVRVKNICCGSAYFFFLEWYTYIVKYHEHLQNPPLILRSTNKYGHERLPCGFECAM
jgi:hypothetical protein